jgi:hypothetical protein
MKDSGPNQSAQPVPNYFRSTCVCQCPNSCPNLREGYWVLQDCRVETPDWGCERASARSHPQSGYFHWKSH